MKRALPCKKIIMTEDDNGYSRARHPSPSISRRIAASISVPNYVPPPSKPASSSPNNRQRLLPTSTHSFGVRGRGSRTSSARGNGKTPPVAVPAVPAATLPAGSDAAGAELFRQNQPGRFFARASTGAGCEQLGTAWLADHANPDRQPSFLHFAAVGGHPGQTRCPPALVGPGRSFLSSGLAPGKQLPDRCGKRSGYI